MIQEVEIRLDPSPARFSARLLFDPPEALAPTPLLGGHFKLGSEHLVTGVTLDALPGSG